MRHIVPHSVTQSSGGELRILPMDICAYLCVRVRPSRNQESCCGIRNHDHLSKARSFQSSREYTRTHTSHLPPIFCHRRWDGQPHQWSRTDQSAGSIHHRVKQYIDPYVRDRSQRRYASPGRYSGKGSTGGYQVQVVANRGSQWRTQAPSLVRHRQRH